MRRIDGTVQRLTHNFTRTLARSLCAHTGVGFLDSGHPSLIIFCGDADSRRLLPVRVWLPTGLHSAFGAKLVR